MNEQPCLTEVELHDLAATKSGREWDDVADRIKDARGGVYPPDWWQMVQRSGLYARVKAAWTKP